MPTFASIATCAWMSILAAVSLPIFAWFSLRDTNPQNYAAIFPVAIASALVIVKHHDNIRRLLAGTENRFGNRNAK